VGGIATGGVWSSSGGGTFLPDVATLNATYSPTSSDIANGFVTLTLSSIGNGVCSTATSSTKIVFTPSQDLSLTVTPTEDTLCAGADGLITILNSESGVSYQAELSGSPVGPLMDGTNGDLDLTLLNGSFTAGVDNILTIRTHKTGCASNPLSASPIIRKSTISAPSISAPGGTQLCTGSPITLTAPAGYPAYQWYHGAAKIVDAIGTTYSTLAIGSYALLVSDGLCKAKSPSVNVSYVTAEPVVAVSGTVLSTTTSSGYYQWYVENTPGDSKAIHGANSSTCPVFFNASYFVAVTHNNCRLVSIPVTVNDGGLQSLQRKHYQVLSDSSILIFPPADDEKLISLYPNPADDAFTVDYKCTSSGTVLIELFNSMGDKMLSRAVTPVSGTLNETFDKLDLQPGIYLISITEGAKRVIRNIQIN
jgi:hypothetical protein